jgi:hypothetical protein
MIDRRISSFAVMSLVACCGANRYVNRVCGSSSSSDKCTGELAVPPSRIDDFERAGRFAIDVVYSERFADEVRGFMAAHANDADLRAAWGRRSALQIVEALRAGIIGVRVETAGGVRRWFAFKIYGTIAKEGGVASGGPVEVNQYAADGMSAAQLAGTIVHEVAHGIGLTHPHMGGPLEKNWSIALCEPPYLLGAIVERIATDRRETVLPHCPRLDPPRRQARGARSPTDEAPAS